MYIFFGVVLAFFVNLARFWLIWNFSVVELQENTTQFPDSVPKEPWGLCWICCQTQGVGAEFVPVCARGGD